MKRFLIELFSRRTPENLISLFKERYDGVYFLYFSKDDAPNRKTKEHLKKTVLDILGFSPQFISIPEDSVESALSVLSSLCTSENQYDIDLTGGNEGYIAAAGIFSAQHPDFDICLHRYDIRTGKRINRYPKERKDDCFFPHYLSAEQILTLNGLPPLSAPSPHFTRGTLKRDTLSLWNALKLNLKEWNTFCSIPTDTSKIKENRIRKCLDYKKSHRQSCDAIIKKLQDAGVIKDAKYVSNRNKEFLDFQILLPEDSRFLLEKAGNLLEMYTALAATESGLFHDVRVGVTVDWNGTVLPHWKPDPRNEIDLFLMRENLPILASCKNTVPQNDYLYEIMIMTKHYGGYFGTPMLLSSAFASPTVRARAQEMGIVLIDGIRKMSFEELVHTFQKHFS